MKLRKKSGSLHSRITRALAVRHVRLANMLIAAPFVALRDRFDHADNYGVSLEEIVKKELRFKQY